MKPSVTTLLDLLNKPALLNWSNKIGLKGISLEEYRKKSFSNGTSLHNQIENFIKTGKKMEKKEYQDNFNKLFKNKKIIDCEKSIETDYFIGRYDIKFKDEDGRTYIGDFKTSKGVWFDNILQLVAYNMSERVDGITVIKIPEFKIRYLNIKDDYLYEELLIYLSHIYKIKNKIISINPYY